MSKTARSDKSSGINSKTNSLLADKLIRNTYKTLLSRGQKGCFIFCEDIELGKYLEKRIKK
jgi:DUF2075 family protein